MSNGNEKLVVGKPGRIARAMSVLRALRGEGLQVENATVEKREDGTSKVSLPSRALSIAQRMAFARFLRRMIAAQRRTPRCRCGSRVGSFRVYAYKGDRATELRCRKLGHVQ